MKEQFLKAGLIFGASFLIWCLIKPSAKINVAETPAPSKENAMVALKAYMSAVRDHKSASELEELNRMIQSEYGLRVYQKRSDGKYYVSDTQGNDILKP